jgi:hypothetical protein
MLDADFNSNYNSIERKLLAENGMKLERFALLSFFREAKRILKPHGQLIIATPILGPNIM